MFVNFSLSTGEELNLDPGLPDKYSGPVIQGAAAFNIRSDFGQIIMLEVNTGEVSLQEFREANWNLCGIPDKLKYF